MNIFYRNNFNEEINLNSINCKVLADTDLFDWVYKYSTKNYNENSIKEFTQDIAEKSIDVTLSANTVDELNNIKIELVKIFEKDISDVNPGKLYFNNCYLNCYFISSEKSKKYVNTKRTTVTFGIVVEKPQWFENIKTEFTKGTNDVDNTGFKYPKNYPYNYSSNLVNKELTNTSYKPCDFEICITGACLNPIINIAGHEYSVNYEIGTGEYLFINSDRKKIWVQAIDGSKVNLFSYRNRESDVFQKIPDGSNSVNWSGDFSFSITLLEERSEPYWN